MTKHGRAGGQHAIKRKCSRRQAGRGEGETGVKPGFPSLPALGLPCNGRNQVNETGV